MTTRKINVSFTLDSTHGDDISVCVSEKLGIVTKKYPDNLVLHGENFGDVFVINDSNIRISPTGYFNLYIPQEYQPIVYKQGKVSFVPEVHKIIHAADYTKHNSSWLLNTAELTRPITTSDGLIFSTVANYYEAMKTLDFSIREHLSTLPPSETRTFYSKEAMGIREDWVDIRNKVMLRALEHKFMTNPHFTSLLVGSGTYPIVNFNPEQGKHWGVSTIDFTGKNVLGKMLMSIRNQLLYEDIPY